MTKKQWESLKEEDQIFVQEDNPFLSEPLPDYEKDEKEKIRMREILRRAKEMGVESEEEFSKLSFETGHLVGLSGPERLEFKLNDDYNKLVNYARESNSFLKDTININLRKDNNKENRLSLEAMKYLTTGERQLVTMIMNNGILCKKINTVLREFFDNPSDDVFNSTNNFLKIRQLGVNTLKMLKFIKKMHLERGVSALERKFNLLNKSESILDLHKNGKKRRCNRF
ncbi:MAG: hypothetical protein LBR11_08230 [Deltaproteobacteria bacterium]|jgi:hypothetical protein|nr:hypothetical protein [Deltaproteobacteria bacterium]